MEIVVKHEVAARGEAGIQRFERELRRCVCVGIKPDQRPTPALEMSERVLEKRARPSPCGTWASKVALDGLQARGEKLEPAEIPLDHAVGGDVPVLRLGNPSNESASQSVRSPAPRLSSVARTRIDAPPRPHPGLDQVPFDPVLHDRFDTRL